MVETGLLIAGDDIPVPYDRFRDRVMFPITDARGRVIAFGGRALEKDVPAKYLNSPETPLFHKGDNLYNLATARQAAHNGAQLIVVEGYVDVIAMVTSGFAGAVAPLGTALTENQLALLWKMADEPILCFDGDRAGQKAAWRAADLALPHLKPDKSLRFALLPEGQDPDDLARSGGRGAIEEVISAARGLADVLWSREIEGGSFATPERRAGLEARIGELANSVRDEVVRRYYKQDLLERLQRTFAPEPQRRFAGKGNFRESPRFPQRFPSPANRFSTGGRPGFTPGQTIPRGPYQAASAQLANSPILRGQRSALLPPRGADPAMPDRPPLAAARPPRGGGRAGTGPSRGPQAARRDHRGLRQRPSPFPRPLGTGREDARRSREGRIFAGTSKG